MTGNVMQRLKKRADFLHAARGVKWVMPAFVLQARQTGPVRQTSPVRQTGPVRQAGEAPSQNDARLGFTASRRVGGAVVRNFARRRLKAAAAQVFPGKARHAHDYVLIARQATSTCRFQAIVDDLDMAIQKIHMRLDKVGANPRPGDEAGHPGHRKSVSN